MATVRRNSAFTLLEVLLALSLAAITMIAVTMAVRFQLRLVEAGRTQVEQAQLARAIMHRIADDIRSTIRYDPMNTQSGSSGSSSGTQGGGTGGEQWRDRFHLFIVVFFLFLRVYRQHEPVPTGHGGCRRLPSDGLAQAHSRPLRSGQRHSSRRQPGPTSGPVRVHHGACGGTSSSTSSSLSDVTSDVKTVAYFLAGGQSGSFTGGQAQAA